MHQLVASPGQVCVGHELLVQSHHYSLHYYQVRAGNEAAYNWCLTDLGDELEHNPLSETHGIPADEIVEKGGDGPEGDSSDSGLVGHAGSCMEADGWTGVLVAAEHHLVQMVHEEQGVVPGIDTAVHQSHALNQHSWAGSRHHGLDVQAKAKHHGKVLVEHHDCAGFEHHNHHNWAEAQTHKHVDHVPAGSSIDLLVAALAL